MEPVPTVALPTPTPATPGTAGKDRARSRGVGRGEWRLRLVAAVACACVHFALGFWLRNAMEVVRVEPDAATVVTIVEWVSRTPAVPASPLPPVRPAGPAATPQPPASVESPPPEPGNAPDPGATVPEPQAPSSGVLDLSLPEDGTGLGFGPSEPLAPRRDALPEPRAVLRLEFQDNSLGGRLQRMRNASICAGLRRSISEARRMGDGSGVDIASRQLRELGCR